MKKSSRFWLVFLAVMLILASLACAALTGGNSGGNDQPEDKPTRAAKDTKAPKPTKPPKGQPTEEPASPATEKPAQPTSSGSGEYDTAFPLPEDVQNFMQLDPGNDSINFQTSMSLEEVIEFYREAFQAQGLTERTLLTVIEAGSSFSMVFDGAPNGLAVVIQGVVLSPTQTNVNIRYEDV